jgi:hypothetical protein
MMMYFNISFKVKITKYSELVGIKWVVTVVTSELSKLHWR